MGTRSSVVLEALTSASWSLLSQRVGDALMFYLPRYSSIFMPLNRRKHHQVAGIPINDLCWDFLKHTSKSKNQKSSFETATKKKKHDKDTKLKGPQNQNRVMKPDKNGTVPLVLWKFFKNRANTLAKTILSFIPLASLVTVKCRCKGSKSCLRCCSDREHLSFLLQEDDPSDYRKLLNQCFVVSSNNAPLPPPFDPHCRWSQFEIVRQTIETTLQENAYTNNVICTGYNKQNHSSIVFEALTSASWSLLLQREMDSKKYGEYRPASSEIFRFPLVSFLYERGWRQAFTIWGGFPSPDGEPCIIIVNVFVGGINSKLTSKSTRHMPAGHRPVHVKWKDLDKCNVCQIDEVQQRYQNATGYMPFLFEGSALKLQYGRRERNGE